jgi:hypothetical protein
MGLRRKDVLHQTVIAAWRATAGHKAMPNSPQAEAGEGL